MAPSTLRHRKHKADNNTPTATVEQTEAEQSLSLESPFRLVPLVALPVFARLDVLPFAGLYALLIASDVLWQQQAAEEKQENDVIISQELGRFILTLLQSIVLISHVGLVLLSQWKVSFQALVGYRIASNAASNTWTHCFVQSRNMGGETGIVPVIHEEQAVVVNFHDCRFRWSSTQPDVDIRLWKPSLNVTTVTKPTFQPLKYPIDLPLAFFRTWKGHATLNSANTAEALYGPNQMMLQLPTLLDLLGEQVVAPFFLFQVVCVVLWSLDEYWYYALFTLGALLLFETTMAFHRLKSLQRLHEAGSRHQHQRVYVKRANQWTLVNKAELVPGDWVSLAARGAHSVPIPADILLCQGTAVCDEALLTGESIPQIKHALEEEVSSENNDKEVYLDVQDALHKESILFGGTSALVTHCSTSEGGVTPIDLAPDQGVTGIVLRTGFATTQGKLLRTMAHSPKADSIHTWDTLVFILLLVAFAIVAAAYVLYEGWQDDRRNRFRLILHVIMIVTSVVPPELPMELSLAVTNSFGALVRRAQVYCTEMFRIPWAGQVDMCCFDKTGTLTSDEMILRGVRLFPASGKDEEHCLLNPWEENVPDETLRVMVACQSLAIAGYRRTATGTEPAIVGDPLEVAVLKKTGYTLVGNNVVRSPDGAKMMATFHRFAFSSKLKRMTVLATQQGIDKDLWALTKGAPETMKTFFKSDSIPTDYDKVAFYHMSRGRRVLAMGFRRVGVTQNLEKIKKRGREYVENDLIFAGFLVLDCPLKPETKKVMTELRESGHQVAMITGDAILTAVEVARQIEMVPKSAEHDMYRIQLKAKANELSTKSPLSILEAVDMSDESEQCLEYSEFWRLKKEGRASFCLSGDCVMGLATFASQKGSSAASERKSTNDEKALLMDTAVQRALTDLVPLVSVFARHAPYQKEAVIAALNHAGFTTLMVGDGTNDVGALKRAHVGISIVSAPEVEAKQREYSKAYKNAKKKGKPKSKTVQDTLKELQEAQQELDEVELGDASVAAPFTSRSLTIKCVKDVVQQGRCTLVTMLQIYKILGINCLVNAMVLSRLFLYGVKQGDRQLTILGTAVAALFYFVTRAEPLSTLSPIRPPSSVLCFEALASIGLQCIVHLVAILITSETALAFVDPFDPSMVPDGPFNPNVLNTCTFLVLCLITINTFAVNYRGRPFMQSLSENRLLFRSLQACYAILLICSLEVFPPLNDLMQLTALPTVSEADDIESKHPLFQLVRLVGFQVFLPALMAVDTVFAFAADRMIRR